jgi:hypothetical protein
MSVVMGPAALSGRGRASSRLRHRPERRLRGLAHEVGEAPVPVEEVDLHMLCRVRKPVASVISALVAARVLCG